MHNCIRWKHAIDLNKHILNGDFDYNTLLPRLEKNQDYLFNGYLEFIINKFHAQLI